MLAHTQAAKMLAHTQAARMLPHTHIVCINLHNSCWRNQLRHATQPVACTQHNQGAGQAGRGAHTATTMHERRVAATAQTAVYAVRCVLLSTQYAVCCSVLWYVAIDRGVRCNATGDILHELEVF